MKYAEYTGYLGTIIDAEGKFPRNLISLIVFLLKHLPLGNVKTISGQFKRSDLCSEHRLNVSDGDVVLIHTF